ncbi:ectoine hydroxylase-related dioxygenase (phytanoyl-CoA dioxygenase family) [Parvibaculum indicum]|uniref:phytanoyl-CoA dioxygenase family protein n=1 Tax=Parvibaculum indicum TaxID=562969 RepID=UPI00141F38A8|nr:phytanoyl-CoA dioxygenase family protein [Parvibaculum indicum]NIJ42743.1 ectoine hydroxylase-related dioxygenase (phytanoyl-CoA dioxygenase family) [Parvibaculum indicum]
MPKLDTLPANASTDEILTVLKRDGALILKDVLTPDQVAQVLKETLPYIEATPPGEDDFTGRKTTRTGALVARSEAAREMVANKTITEAAQAFLKPFCERIQLHLTQIIRIRPGQPKQQIHRDRWAWGTYITNVEPQFNTIWAITDFTKENGATQVCPGSLDWPDNYEPSDDEIGYAEMSAGSVLIYSGGVFHGGGANNSNGDRIGINITYTLGWLRQEENQYLACPPDIAKTLSPELQALIGYSMGSYALGYYTPPLPPGEGPEIVPPEYALGNADVQAAQFGSEELRAEVSAAIRGEK